MKYWTGKGVFQWEHLRTWNIANAASEFSRAEGAILIPGGFTSLSFFFRRSAQSASTFSLGIWTAPVFFKDMDTDITAGNALEMLLPLELEPADCFSMTGTGAKVFGGKLKASQPMGSMLFWEIKNTGAQQATLTGDLYIVPNHIGSLSLPGLSKSVGDFGGGFSRGGGIQGLPDSLK